MSLSLETLLKYVLEGNPFMLIVIGGTLLLFYSRSLTEFFEYLGTRKQKHLTTALESGKTEDIVNAAMQEQLNRILYKKTTGIFANQKLRKNLHRVVSDPTCNIEIDDLSKVKSFLQVKDNRLEININWTHKFEYWLITAGSIIVILSGAMYGAIAFLGAGDSLKLQLVGVVFFLVYYTIGLLLVVKLRPRLKSAKKISVELEAFYALQPNTALAKA